MTADELASAVVHRHLGDLDSATAFEVTEAVAATIRLVERAAESRGRRDMRERCAKVAEQTFSQLDPGDQGFVSSVSETIAAAIRALPDAPAEEPKL